MEAMFALHRVALAGAEAIASLNIEGVRALSKQAGVASQPLPTPDQFGHWFADRANAVPKQVDDAMSLSRRSYAIAATTAAEWMGICATQTNRLSRESLSAIDQLMHLASNGGADESNGVRSALEAANSAYFAMLDAFEAAADSIAQASRDDSVKK